MADHSFLYDRDLTECYLDGPGPHGGASRDELTMRQHERVRRETPGHRHEQLLREVRAQSREWLHGAGGWIAPSDLTLQLGVLGRTGR